MGDFGEVLLPEYHGADVWPPEAIDDGVVHDEEAVRRGLKLFCWLRQEAAARPADEDCGARLCTACLKPFTCHSFVMGSGHRVWHGRQ